MKPLSLRWRITLWYFAIIFLILFVCFSIMYSTTIRVMKDVSEDRFLENSITLASKVLFDNNNAVTAVDMDNESLSRGVTYTLYSTDGRFVAGWQPEWLNSYEVLFNEVRYIEREHEVFWLLYDKAVYKDNDYAGRLRLLMSTEQAMSAVEEMRGIIKAVLFPALIFAFIGGLFIAGRALRPIKDITYAAQEIGTGYLGKRINLDGKDEIGVLAKTFNHMADSLQQSFNREKQFTSDVSHEVRTKIAVILSSAENAADIDDIEMYRKINRITIEKSRELKRLVSHLLSLAREEHMLTAEDIDINAVVAGIVSEANEWPETIEKGININTEIQKALKIKGDFMQITRMLLNLVENSVKYGKTGGQTHIKISSNGNTVSISVCDNGIGIAEKDLPHIFERLYRADTSRTDGSSGLGLSFVKMIVKQHHGIITASSVLNEGTCFNIEMPA